MNKFNSYKILVISFLICFLMACESCGLCPTDVRSAASFPGYEELDVRNEKVIKFCRCTICLYKYINGMLCDAEELSLFFFPYRQHVICKD